MKTQSTDAVRALTALVVLSLTVLLVPALRAEPSHLVMPHIAGAGDLPVYGVWSEASAANVPVTARAICVQGLPLSNFEVLKRFTKVEVIDFGIPQPDTVPTAEVLRIVGGLSSLRALNFWCCDKIEGNWLEVIGSMKQLRELVISRLGRYSGQPKVPVKALAAAIQAAGIERLDIGRTQLDGSVVDLLKACKSLTHLRVDNHYDGQRLPSEALVVLASLALECLEIESADLTEEFFTTLSKNSVLTRLRIGSCRGISPGGLATLSKVPNLTALGFRFIDNMTDQHVQALATIKGLEVLDLSYGLSVNTNIGRRGDWPKDYRVTGGAFQYLSALPRLTTLIAQSTPAVTDEALRHIAGMSGLVYLDICYNDAWTSKGIALLARCEKLTELRLDRADVHDSPMNDDVLKELAGLPALTKLSITGCEGATKAGFPSFQKMAKLRWLSVAGCTWVDAAFLTAVSKARELEQLHMAYCNGVADDGLAALKEHKSLRVLGLYGCGNVTDESIDTFKSLPQLSILDLRRTKIFGDSAAKLAKELAEKQVEVARY